MIKPQSFKYVCSCGYSKVVSFKSDCLSAMDIASISPTCPQCQKTMEKRPLGLFDLFKGFGK